MKTLILAVLTLVALSACGTIKTSIQGPGVADSRTYPVESFERVAVYGEAKAIIKVGQATQLSISGDDNILPYISAYVSNNTLVIAPKANAQFSPKQPLVYHLLVSQLSAVELTGAVNTVIESLDNTHFSAQLTDASHLQVSGQTEHFEFNASGASRVSAFNLQSRQATATISGATNADIHVLDQLKANLSGASTLQFTGSPVVDSQVSTASTIRNVAAQTLD